MEECEIIHRSEGKNYRTSRKVENQNRSGTNSVAMNSIFRALQQPFSFFAIIGLKNQISGQECSTALGWLSCLKLRFQDSGSSTKTVSHTGEGIPQRVLSRKRKRASGWTKKKKQKQKIPFIAPLIRLLPLLKCLSLLQDLLSLLNPAQKSSPPSSLPD